MLETYDELEWNLARTDGLQSNISEAIYRELEEHLYGKIDGKACERAAGYIHEHIKDKEIKTNIPDQWPKVAKFLRDGVHTEKQEGDIRWLCFVCKNTYYANTSVKFTKCPYCGVNIKKITNLIKAKNNGENGSRTNRHHPVEVGAE